jgi:hypothetical protein
MIDYDTWLADQSAGAISKTRRAIAAWRRIQRNPAAITIMQEDGTTLAEQTVRVVVETTQGTDDRGEGLVTAITQQAKVFGVSNHPSVADTNIQIGDLFRHLGQLYRVVTVVNVPGEVHATAEVQG